MSSFESRLRGYRLTTAEILYHLPDHPALLQTYIWQEFDLAPKFPILNRFLQFWQNNLEGRLHSVRVAARGLIAPAELRHAGQEFTLH
ncbi:MAG: usg protein [Rhizomicrobium sp.]